MIARALLLTWAIGAAVALGGLVLALAFAGPNARLVARSDDGRAWRGPVVALLALALAAAWPLLIVAGAMGLMRVGSDE